jgi:uncharacterized protein YceH (UPF0502 family)
LRINCERLHPFGDISAVEGFLHELAARPAGALVAELPRQAGARENRWIHLLSGAPPAQELAAHASTPAVEGAAVAASEIAAIKTNIARLEAEVGELKALLARICSELGIPR